jgi:hypothetical protein
MAIRMLGRDAYSRASTIKRPVREMALAYRSGLMARNTRACGGETRLTVVEE